MSGRPANPYYRYFKNFKANVTGSVTEMTLELWRLDKETALDRLNTLCHRLSNLYNLPIIPINWGNREVYMYSGGIFLPKISLISFLHEFRHHMQIAGNIQHYRDKEDDARGWSISLFAHTHPDKFDKAWRNEKIWYLPPYNENWRHEVGL